MPPTDHADSRGRWLGQLLSQHGAALALYAAQWTSAADDCVQEAMVELAMQSPPPERPVAWLYRVVKHRALNDSRSAKRRAAREQHAWQHRLQGQVSGVARHELLDAVAALPDLQREVVLLRTWGNLTFDEMADVLGQSSSTLHRRYTEAIQSLRNVWGTPCPQTMNPE